MKSGPPYIRGGGWGHIVDCVMQMSLVFILKVMVSHRKILEER